MKRIALFALLVTAIGAVVATPLASATKDDARGPACADIIGGGNGGNDGFYANGDGTGRFDMSMDLGAPACKNVKYTFYVSYNGGDFVAISGVANGTTVTMPTQTYTGVTATSNVCVYATSGSKDGDVFDRAPDSGCVPVILDSTPGNSSFS
jgi:hypothetical protein